MTVLIDSSPGIYLEGGEHEEILLPNRYVPQQGLAEQVQFSQQPPKGSSFWFSSMGKVGL